MEDVIYAIIVTYEPKQAANIITKYIATQNKSIKKKIEDQIESNFGFNFNQLSSSTKSHKYARARDTAVYLLEKYANYNHASAAKIFNRDRTAMYNCIKNIKSLLNDDELFLNIEQKVLKQKIIQIEQILSNDNI